MGDIRTRHTEGPRPIPSTLEARKYRNIHRELEQIPPIDLTLSGTIQENARALARDLTLFKGSFMNTLFGHIYLGQKHQGIVCRDVEALSSGHYYFTWECEYNVGELERHAGVKLRTNSDDYVSIKDLRNEKSRELWESLLNPVGLPQYRQLRGPTVDEMVQTMRTCQKRFLIFPLILSSCEVGAGHANYLILDREKATLEKFEPNGAAFYNEEIARVFDIVEMDIRIVRYFNQVFARLGDSRKITFLTPVGRCELGPQHLQAEADEWDLVVDEARRRDPGGFCLAWSLWYTDLRLSNPQLSTDEVYAAMMTQLTSGERSARLTIFIRNYAEFLIRMKDKVLSEIRPLVAFEFPELARLLQEYEILMEKQKATSNPVAVQKLDSLQVEIEHRLSTEFLPLLMRYVGMVIA